MKSFSPIYLLSALLLLAGLVLCLLFFRSPPDLEIWEGELQADHSYYIEEISLLCKYAAKDKGEDAGIYYLGQLRDSEGNPLLLSVGFEPGKGPDADSHDFSLSPLQAAGCFQSCSLEDAPNRLQEDYPKAVEDLLSCKPDASQYKDSAVHLQFLCRQRDNYETSFTKPLYLCFGFLLAALGIFLLVLPRPKKKRSSKARRRPT